MFLKILFKCFITMEWEILTVKCVTINHFFLVPSIAKTEVQIKLIFNRAWYEGAKIHVKKEAL